MHAFHQPPACIIEAIVGPSYDPAVTLASIRQLQKPCVKTVFARSSCFVCFLLPSCLVRSSAAFRIEQPFDLEVWAVARKTRKRSPPPFLIYKTIDFCLWSCEKDEEEMGWMVFVYVRPFIKCADGSRRR